MQVHRFPVFEAQYHRHRARRLADRKASDFAAVEGEPPSRIQSHLFTAVVFSRPHLCSLVVVDGYRGAAYVPERFVHFSMASDDHIRKCIILGVVNLVRNPLLVWALTVLLRRLL